MPSHALAPEVAGARHVTRLWIGTTWRDRSSGCRSHSLKDVPIVLPIVLWFLKFQDHVSGGDCARRIQASPARSRQAPGCCGSPGMKWDDFYVEKQCKSQLWCCAALCWRILIVDLGIFVGCYNVLHSCGLFSQVMTERYREIQRAGAWRKAGSMNRMNRALPLCLWWLRIRICPNSVDLSGRPQVSNFRLVQ